MKHGETSWCHTHQDRLKHFDIGIQEAVREALSVDDEFIEDVAMDNYDNNSERTIKNFLVKLRRRILGEK